MLAFAPALLLLYYSLSGYTWPKSQVVYFDDRWIFGFLALGIVAGAALFFLELIFAYPGFAVPMLFIVAEELAMTVILNFPSVRRKGSGRFYGFAFGTAISAGIVMGEYAELFTYRGYDLIGMAVLFVYSVGLELVGASTGGIVGLAVESRKLPYGLAMAIVFQAAFGLLNFPVLHFQPSFLTAFFAAGGTGMSVALYLYVLKRILPPRKTEERKKRII